MRVRLLAILLALFGCSSRESVVPPASHPPVAASAHASTTATREHADDPGWPRTLVDDAGWRVTVHQPQVERWTGGELAARLAVVVAPPDAAAVYATVAITAHANADKRRRLVALDDVTLTRTHFAAPTADEAAVDRALHRDLPRLLPAIALDRLVTDLVAAQTEVDDTVRALGNEPPHIFVARKLAVLIPVDGAPVWRRASPRYRRLVDTRALVLADRLHPWLYTYVGDTWYRARSLASSWRTATLVPAGADELREALVRQGDVDLFDARDTPLQRALAVGRVPDIVVARVPAELVVVDGEPALAPIAGTTLASIENSDADLFRDNADGRYYVLLSGRWFAAPLLDGPWRYVRPAALPDGFARIPPDHPHARALASVPGTALSREALIVDEVPEIARLRPEALSLQPVYEGAPHFLPIAGTTLRWAINTRTPVLQVADGRYYALGDGVWFTSGDAQGPWRAATSVPDVIYALPPSAPLSFATYVRVYGVDGEFIRVGYTPGYFGALVGDDGVVVFGNGYVQPPFVGTSWIGRPATYGLRARWQPKAGWTFGDDVVRPWWTPWRESNALADEQTDVYADWGAAMAPRVRVARYDVVDGADDLYAGSDDWVYRARGDGWERRGPDGWAPAEFSSLQASSAGGVGVDELAILRRAQAARRRFAR